MKSTRMGSTPRTRGLRMFAVSMLLSALALPACKCGESGPGESCDVDGDCEAGLVCNEAGVCAEPAPEDAELTITPTMQSFGSLLVGETSAATTFTVENTGGGVSDALAVALGGSAAGDFSIDADTCAGAELAVGDTCTIDVTFTPTAEGNRSAQLTVSADNLAANLTASLSGTGASPGELVISPTPHNFGTVSVGETSNAVDFTVTNTGGSETGDVTATLSGGDATEFEVVDDGCSGGTLAADATCTITVAFAPTSAGMKTTNLSVVADGVDGGATAALSGAAVEPPLVRVTPQNQDFGDVVIGESSPNFTFTVTNGGGAPTGALTAALGGTDAAEFTIASDACSGATLAGGASCAVIVTFDPTTTGAKSATLDVSGTPGGSASANLTGNGLDQGALAINPSMHDFGSATVNTAGGTQVFTVTNGGGAAVGPLSTALAGANPTNFTIVAGGNSCQGITLQAAGSCTIAVEFNPTAEGVRTADLNVTAPGASTTASLTGTGTAVVTPALFEIAPLSQAFGSVLVGGTSMAMQFTVTNTGGSASGVPSVTLAGANLGDFAIAGNGCTTTLASMASCTIDVTFSPTAAGGRQATLNVTALNGGTATASLTGNGLQPGNIVPNPSALNFGQVVNGGMSGILAVVVTNTGGATTSALTSMVSSAEFTVASDTCTGATLAPMSNCTIQMRFAPTSLGVKAESLTVSAGASNTFTVALTGESLQEFTFSPTTHDFGAVPVGSTDNQVFTITNTDGTGEATRIIDFTSDSAQFTVAPASCNLAPGNTCNLTVTFAPTGMPGARSATITLTDDTGATYTIDVVGSAAGPIQISPDPLDFGDVTTGTTQDLTFTVTNNDTSATGVLHVEFSGGTSFGIVNQDCHGTTLAAAGGNCDVTIRFYPTAAGVVSGTLTVTDALGSTDSATVTGNGVPPGAISVTGTNNFGTVAATNTAAQTFTITNTGAQPTAAITPTLTNMPLYSITANTCINTLSILDPGESCSITVTVAPNTSTTLGTQTAVFTVNGVATNLTANIVSQLSIAPTTGAFGNQVINTTSNTISFTVTNSGSVAVAGPAVDALEDTLNNPTAGDVFAIDTNNCSNIPAGMTCTILVEFTPDAVGDFEGELEVDDGGNIIATADLTGSGIADANLEFDDDTFTYFGFVEEGSTGVTRTFTLRNTGDNATTALSTTLAPATGSGFTITNNCTGTLAANSSCDIVATFAPTTTSTNSLAITVTASNAGSDMITLTGTGIDITGNPARLEITPGAHQFADTVEGLTSMTQTFTIRNRSGVTTGTIAIAEAGDTTEFCFGANCTTALPDTCSGQTLAANNTCTFQARFTPTMGAPADLSVTLTASATGVAPASTELQGNRLDQAGLSIAIDPNDTDWTGAFTLEDTAENTSRTGTLVITNVGNQNSGAITVVDSGVGAVHFAIANNGCAAGIAGGASCTVDVVFTPQNQASFSVLVTATPTNGTADSVTVDGDGVAAAQIDVTPTTTVDCGMVAAGRTQAAAAVCGGANTFVVENIGGVPTGELTFSLGNTTDFVISGTNCPDTNNPGDGSYDALAAGASCTVNVKYVPDSISMQDLATFTASATPGGSDTGTLEGESFGSLLITAPPSGTDGTYTYMDTDANSFRDVTFTFQNAAGTSATGPMTVTLSGANSSQFSVWSSDCPGEVLSAGEDCDVVVRFAPTVVTSGLTATLTVSDNQTPDIKTAVVTLTGTGTSP